MIGRHRRGRVDVPAVLAEHDERVAAAIETMLAEVVAELDDIASQPFPVAQQPDRFAVRMLRAGITEIANALRSGEYR